MSNYPERIVRSEYRNRAEQAAGIIDGSGIGRAVVLDFVMDCLTDEYRDRVREALTTLKEVEEAIRYLAEQDNPLPFK